MCRYCLVEKLNIKMLAFLLYKTLNLYVQKNWQQNILMRNLLEFILFNQKIFRLRSVRKLSEVRKLFLGLKTIELCITGNLTCFDSRLSFLKERFCSGFKKKELCLYSSLVESDTINLFQPSKSYELVSKLLLKLGYELIVCDNLKHYTVSQAE